MGSEMPMGETVKVILTIIGFFFVIAILFTIFIQVLAKGMLFTFTLAGKLTFITTLFIMRI